MNIPSAFLTASTGSGVSWTLSTSQPENRKEEQRREEGQCGSDCVLSILMFKSIKTQTQCLELVSGSLGIGISIMQCIRDKQDPLYIPVEQITVIYTVINGVQCRSMFLEFDSKNTNGVLYNSLYKHVQKCHNWCLCPENGLVLCTYPATSLHTDIKSGNYIRILI